jgi:hypothetical protein
MSKLTYKWVSSVVVRDGPINFQRGVNDTYISQLLLEQNI